jgi:hypothetical protein
MTGPIKRPQAKVVGNEMPPPTGSGWPNKPEAKPASALKAVTKDRPQNRPQNRPRSAAELLKGLFDAPTDLAQPSAKPLTKNTALNTPHEMMPIKATSSTRGKEITATKPDVTSASKIKNGNLSSEKQKRAEDAERRALIIRTVLITAVCVVLLVAVAEHFQHHLNAQAGDGSHAAEQAARASEQAALSTKKLQDRVNYHREEIGRKLNRERIKVEFENGQAAPIGTRGPKQPSAPDMMLGIPFVSQRPSPPLGPDKPEVANPDESENRVQYTLAEQQAATDWENTARKQYIDDFIANAAKAGYKIKVEPNGRVVVLGTIPVSGGQQPGVLQIPPLPNYLPPTR